MRASVVVPAATASAAPSAKPTDSAAESAQPMVDDSPFDAGGFNYVGGTVAGGIPERDAGARRAGYAASNRSAAPTPGSQVKAPATRVGDLRLLGVVLPSRTALLVDPAGKGWIVRAGDRVGKEEAKPGCVRRWRVARVRADRVVLESGGSGCSNATRALLLMAAHHGP